MSHNLTYHTSFVLRLFTVRNLSLLNGVSYGRARGRYTAVDVTVFLYNKWTQWVVKRMPLNVLILNRITKKSNEMARKLYLYVLVV